LVAYIAYTAYLLQR